jgi:hypothetical protein
MLTALKIATQIACKYIPDLVQQQNATQELSEALAKAQVDVNLQEAQSTNLFISGWRPSIGWICGIGLFYQFLLQPLSVGLGHGFPPLDVNTLISLVTSMLGLGGYRTFEKTRKK